MSLIERSFSDRSGDERSFSDRPGDALPPKITSSRLPTARQANTTEASWFAQYHRDAMKTNK